MQFNIPFFVEFRPRKRKIFCTPAGGALAPSHTLETPTIPLPRDPTPGLEIGPNEKFDTTADQHLAEAHLSAMPTPCFVANSQVGRGI